MKKLRICIGSNDKKTVANSHMGDTGIFLIYDVNETKQYEKIDEKINKYKDLEHAQSDKMKKILELVGDIDILIARQKSPNFRKIAANTKYQPIVIKKDNIKDVLQLLTDIFDEVVELVNKKNNGEKNAEIPEFS